LQKLIFIAEQDAKKKARLNVEKSQQPLKTYQLHENSNS
jgi:hypothetical protein